MLKRVVKHLSTNLDSVGVRQARYGVISAFSRQSSSDSCQAGQQQPAQAACRFASAYSDEPTLAKAVTGCLAQVQDQLGPETRLDLCQLLVTLGHGEHLRLAPMVLYTCLSASNNVSMKPLALYVASTPSPACQRFTGAIHSS